YCCPDPANDGPPWLMPCRDRRPFMTATNSMAFRAFSHRFQLDDTASRLNLLPLRPNANGTPRRASSEREISFGPFRLLPHQRLLTKAGTEVRVGSRALDILIALLERPGKLVTRRELMERVWPPWRQISTSISPRYVGPWETGMMATDIWLPFLVEDT